MLCNQNDAKDIVDSLKTKPKAFAIAVLGHECTVTGSTCHAMHIPALDRHGKQVILKACVHQLGAEHICLASRKGDNIQVAESQLVAITGWKHEMTADLRQALLSAPAKTCAQDCTSTFH